MGILWEIKQSLNQKSVVRNILFCLAIIILMHLLYGAYRSSAVLQEGKKGKKGKVRTKKKNKCNKLVKKLDKLEKRKVKKGKGKKNIKLDKKINKTKTKMIKHKCISGTGGASTGGADTGGADCLVGYKDKKIFYKEKIKEIFNGIGTPPPLQDDDGQPQDFDKFVGDIIDRWYDDRSSIAEEFYICYEKETLPDCVNNNQIQLLVFNLLILFDMVYDNKIVDGKICNNVNIGDAQTAWLKKINNLPVPVIVLFTLFSNDNKQVGFSDMLKLIIYCGTLFADFTETLASYLAISNAMFYNWYIQDKAQMYLTQLVYDGASGGEEEFIANHIRGLNEKYILKSITVITQYIDRLHKFIMNNNISSYTATNPPSPADIPPPSQVYVTFDETGEQLSLAEMKLFTSDCEETGLAYAICWGNFWDYINRFMTRINGEINKNRQYTVNEVLILYDNIAFRSRSASRV